MSNRNMRILLTMAILCLSLGCVTLKPKFSFKSEEKEVKVGVTVGIGKDSLQKWVETAKGWFREDGTADKK